MALFVAAQLRKVAELCQAQGAKVTFEPGWETRKGTALSRPMLAEGGTEHWTGSPNTPTAFLRNGDPGRGLGTLCNVQLKRDGTLHIIAAGYTNHAGIDNKDAVNTVRAAKLPMDSELKPGSDTAGFSGNRYFIGMEGNAGPGAPYTDAMDKAATIWWAACVIAFGWSKTRPPVAGHKELTKRKAGDPSHSMAKRRQAIVAMVAKMTGATPPTNPTQEAPVVTTPKSATFKLGVANCESYGGDRSRAAWEARADIIDQQGWSVVCLSETTAIGRGVMIERLTKLTKHTWKVWTLDGKSVAVLWDDSVFSGVRRRTVSYNTAFGHGAVCVPLTHRKSKLGVDVISTHTRPKSIATDVQKDADIAKGAKLAKGWPCVYAGDFAKTPKLPGWVAATPRVDTMDAAGDQFVDWAWIKGKVAAGKAAVVDPGRLSDHKWLGVELTLGTAATTN